MALLGCGGLIKLKSDTSLCITLKYFEPIIVWVFSNDDDRFFWVEYCKFIRIRMGKKKAAVRRGFLADH